MAFGNAANAAFGVARHGDALDVESRLVALARAGAPLRRALARIAGRLVALRGWERLGFARLRDYAVERAGISGRALQELAQMDCALDGLPRLEAAFVAGRISWTKARLVVRVATREDEEPWLALAQGLTARALAREVRELDERARDLEQAETDEDGEEEDAREAVFVRCSPRVRAKWHRARFLASRVEGRPVPPWAVAERVAAETLSAAPLDAPALHWLEAGDPEVRVRATAASDAPAAAVAIRTRGAPAVNGCAPQGSGTVASSARNAPSNADPFTASLVAGLDAADAFELDARLRRALALEQRLHATLGPLLLAVAEARLYRGHGCESLGAFAREWLGMSPRKAEALVRLERACRLAPALCDAYRAGRLSWAQAQQLVPLVLLEAASPWHAAWVTHAQRVSVRRLDDDVAHALAHGAFEPPGPASQDPQTGARPRPCETSGQFFFSAPRDVARLFRATLATVQRRIERRNGRTSSESEALEAMLEHAFETWQLPTARLRPEHRVFERDHWQCTVPGCSSYRNLQDHHVQFRSAGGSDELANRTTLCAWHHLRGVHAGTVRCLGRAPGRLRFELGVRRGRPPLVAYRSGDRLVS